MSCIRIEREGDRYEVCLDNPEIVASNKKSDTRWQDPQEEYLFDDWDKTKAFLDSVVEKALPADEYNSAFAKAAKEIQGGK